MDGQDQLRPRCAGAPNDGRERLRTAKIPETVCELGLSTGALALYVVFLIHRNSATGTAWPGTPVLKRMSGVGINQLKGKLDELIDQRLIQYFRKRYPDNNHEYYVYLPDQRPESDSLNSDSESDSLNGDSEGGGQIHYSVESDSLISDRGTIRNQRYEPPIGGGDLFDPEIEEKKAKKSKPKPDLEHYRILLAECVRRKPTKEWSAKEISKLKDLAKRQDFASELDTIHAAYTAPTPANASGDYRRRALETLLNNWTTDLDKCGNGGFYGIPTTTTKSKTAGLANMKELGT
jgi:hypothetical protein